MLIFIFIQEHIIVASDDGINSAGGTDEECEQGGNENNQEEMEINQEEVQVDLEELKINIQEI